MKISCALATSLFGATLLLGLPAQAATIAIDYSFNGALTAAPVLMGGLLYLNASATGTVIQPDPIVNAAGNPVTFVTSDALNLSTGLDHGVFTWTFANGDTLSGLMLEDDTTVDFSTNSGPFTQTLTFTGGTGGLAGTTGTRFGEGLLAPTGFSISGAGALQQPGVPEPATWALMLLGFGGIGVMVRSLRRKGVAATCASTQGIAAPTISGASPCSAAEGTAPACRAVVRPPPAAL